jgi:hypothetical protein
VAKSQAELTEWDRTRNDLRGVKETVPPQPSQTVERQAVCKPGRIAESLIGTLAKNGRHIRHLAGPESVTIVITLDGLYGPAGNTPVAFLNENWLIYENLPQGVRPSVAPLPANAQPTAQPPGAEPKPSPFTAEEVKQLNLGDLHMRQNNPKIAAEAYRGALARFPAGEVKVPAPSSSPEPIGEEFRKAITDARRKLAMAILATATSPADLDAGRKVLDLAANTKVTFVGSASSPKPTVSVPAKLILSVKKADLDQADKLSAAEFRKLVTVETVGLPPADAAKKK